MDSRAYLLITLVFYAAGALHALLHAVLRRSALTTVSLIATLLGFPFHTAALALRFREAGHFPAVGLRDGASFLAWAIVLVLLVVQVTTRVEAASLFAYPFVFGLVFVANLTPASGRADPVLGVPRRVAHAPFEAPPPRVRWTGRAGGASRPRKAPRSRLRTPQNPACWRALRAAARTNRGRE